MEHTETAIELTAQQSLEFLIKQAEAEERLGRSLQTDKVRMALRDAQLEIGPVMANAKAQYGKYADIDGIILATTPYLHKYDLVVDARLEEKDDGRIFLVTTLSHSSGQFISSRVALPDLKQTSKNECQEIGGMISYFRRYSMATLLNLAEVDNDGQTATQFKRQPIVSNKPTHEQVTLLLGDLKSIPKDKAKEIWDSFNIKNTNELTVDTYNAMRRSIEHAKN